MKISQEKMVEEIADYLVVYLKSGKLNMNSFIKDIRLNINDLDQLLKIHFILRQDVKTFIKDLNKLIRRFKTSTVTIDQLLFGETRGHINWEKTIKNRLKINYRDKTIFSCTQKNKNYNIKENLVLKELLRVIYNILFKEINVGHLSKYAWYLDLDKLRNQLQHIFKKNIYIKRIMDDNIQVTDRMINDTMKSRNQLYSDAAKLLYTYRRITNYHFNKNEVVEMFSQTFITPESKDVIFELYWVMKLIKANTENEKLNIVDGSNSMVASWSDEDFIYEIYHDSTGSNKIQFHVSLDEVTNSDNKFLTRHVDSKQKAMELSKQLFSSSINNSYWSGRPDIIIEIRNKETESLKKIIIGEIKYTNKIETAKQGLRELLDYIMLLRNKQGIYLYNNSEIEIKGMLFVDNMQINEIQDDLIKVCSSNLEYLLVI